jgi:hypothetical protein
VPPHRRLGATIALQFHGRLNELLPPDSRERAIHRAIEGSPSVKDVIEALGVPHVEVDVIIVEGVSVGFDHRVRDGEHVAVYPSSSNVRGHPLRHLEPPPIDPDRLRFVLDGHLGRLAAYLRMLGFDTAYANRADDDALAALASREERTLLTRDRGLLKRAIVRRGYLVRSDRPHEQLREVVERFGLGPSSRLFGRCLRCNGLLEPIAPEAARPRVPPRVAAEQAEFRGCAACGGLYWRGSHHARMLRLIEAVVPEATRS